MVYIRPSVFLEMVDCGQYWSPWLVDTVNLDADVVQHLVNQRLVILSGLPGTWRLVHWYTRSPTLRGDLRLVYRAALVLLIEVWAEYIFLKIREYLSCRLLIRECWD